MAHDVFISYSHRDAETADAVCAVLEADGVRCWIAPRDVPVGRSWKESIVEAIGASRAVVLLLSGAADRSTQVAQEVSIAFDAEPRIPVLPFRIEDVRPTGDLLYCIGASHWLDALTSDVALHGRRLAKELRARGYVAAPGRDDGGTQGASPPPTGGVLRSPADVAPAERGGTAVQGAGAPAGGRGAPRTGRRRVLLTASAVLAFVAAALGALLFGGRAPATRDAGAVRNATSSPPAPTPGSVRAPAPAAASAAPSAGTPRPPNAPAPESLSVRRSDPADAEGRRMRPSPGAAAGEHAQAPRLARPEAGTRDRGPSPAPAVRSVDCARLLERVSLGEVLSPRESAQLTRDCRDTPR